MSFHLPSSSKQPCLNDRFRFVGHQQFRVEREPLAQPVALQAHALRAVEAEHLRIGRLEADPAIGAGIVDREDRVVPDGLRPLAGLRDAAGSGWAFPPRLGSHDHRAAPQLQRQLDRFGQSRPHVRLDHQRSTTTSMLCRIWRSSCRSSLSEPRGRRRGPGRSPASSDPRTDRGTRLSGRG
jgi:hypothetical protein